MKVLIFCILIFIIILLKRKNNELELGVYQLNKKIQEFEDKNKKKKKQPDQRTFEKRLEGKRKSAEYYYVKKDSFWDSESEKIVFGKVQGVLSNDFVVIPHVSLREVFKHKDNDEDGFKNLSYYHIDMLICSKNYMTPLMGIEFDGKSHEDQEQILRDEFKSALFRMGNIPLVRLNDKNISVIEMYDLIKKEFENAKLCKKCGAPMLKKNGINGEFYGCSNYSSGKCSNSENIGAKWF